jgi:hypothetical protein
MLYANLKKEELRNEKILGSGLIRKGLTLQTGTRKGVSFMAM